MLLIAVLLNFDRLIKSSFNLPANAVTNAVVGFNHSDFGNYGTQENDGNSGLNDDQILDVLSAVFN